MANLLRRAAAAVRDALGRPVPAGALSQGQASIDRAEVAALHRDWGSHPVRGLTPTTMYAMLDAADAGDLSQQSELFLDMRDRDPHLDAEMGKRERAILTLPWSIEPPRNADARETRNAEALAELVAAVPDIEDVVLAMMDAVGHGFSAQEFAGWSRPGAGPRLPLGIAHRPQAWFMLDRDTRSELRLRDRSGNGEPLWPMGWIVHMHRSRAGYLYRAGLVRCLSTPWALRQFSLRDMAEWLEIYGLPMRLGYYPSGAERDQKQTLYRAVRDLGRHAAGIMPEGMRIELLAAADGQADPFMAMVVHAEAVISRAILGGSLSSTPEATGMGSGVADLQGEVKRDLLVSDARQVAGTLTRQLLWPIATLNGLADDPARCPVWRFETSEPEDLGAFSESLVRLQTAGMGPYIPISWVRERAGIPEPVDGEPTLAAPESAPDPEPDVAPQQTTETPDQAAAGQALRRLRAALSIATPAAEEPPIDAQVARLGVALEPAIQGWLARIRTELDASIAAGATPTAFAERLLALYPELPDGELTAVMGEALAASELAGRYDVSEGR